ncbi:MAG: Flp family type IVb pilin [Planctomycetota bacterium]|nr:Flp family type IVb pilin [Planctomycetota bacterium]
MHKVRALLVNLFRDDSGGEVMEYALVLGLISVVAIAVIGSFGTKALARWTSVNSKM